MNALEFHHDKRHKACVDNLSRRVVGKTAAKTRVA